VSMRSYGRLGRAGWVLGLSLGYAGACGGGGDKPISFTPVSSTSASDLYTLALGDVQMVIDGARGARITELSLRGNNVLVTRDENGTYGSTYWPSPQSSWCPAGTACWPPPPAVDSGAYTGSIEAGDSIQLTSAETALEGVSGSAFVVSKRFTAVPESGAVDVTYTLTNSSTTVALSLAPWQVSRVATGGLTFFGQGTGDVTYARDSDPAFAVTPGANDLWYASAAVKHDSKAFADGTGWLAHVADKRVLVVISYPDIQPADPAPGEAELEVFTNGDYVEIEAQGALSMLAPGAALTWTVRWKLRQVPGGTAVEAGSLALASLAARTLTE